MPLPLYFGCPDRPLFGMLHAEGGATAPSMRGLVVASPLLQEGIAVQRALWWLAERLAPDGVATLRFDWHGSGDSSGNSEDITLEGLLQDMQAAVDWMQRQPGTGGIRQLAMRSGCLPLLAAAARSIHPVDLVLWDPVLDGGRMVQEWHRQHRVQLAEVGRYPFATPVQGARDLLGFELGESFLAQLVELDVSAVVLPAGSRLVVVSWGRDPQVDDLLERQSLEGIDVQQLRLDSNDRPGWDDPHRFEDQAFPRQAASLLAECLGKPQPWG